MPVSFNSPARNLFLLGSTGGTVVTNFFKTILDSSTDGVFIAREIAYNYSEQNYILSGFASDSNSAEFGWFEKRDYNSEVTPPTSTLSFRNKVVSTEIGYNSTASAKLLDIHLDYNDNIIACGIANDVPWISKYSNAGVLEWQSTTNSGNVAYKNVTSYDGVYYASGNTESSDGDVAFVEKFDANGNPGWGKAATALGKDINLDGLAANSRGHVVAVGHVEDDSRFKGYIVKIDTISGEVMWDKTLSSSEKQGIIFTPVLCEDVFIDDQDNIYVCGRLQGVPNGTRSFVMKLSPEGNIIWQRETAEDFEYYRIKADGATGQVVVFGRYYDAAGNDQGGVIAKYSRGGEVSWRRTLFSSYAGSNFFGRMGDNGGIALDADPSFYYVLYTDDDINGLNGTPDSYTFGKVSTSGNGLGPFEYDDGESETVFYDIINSDDRVGRLQDGSVRYDISDLATYPFNATRIAFDDYATPVANKKRQMDDAGNFEYSGSPAVRPVDFQELNLLADVYSGSGNWLDQSGKGNDGVVNGATYNGAGYWEFDGVDDEIDFGNQASIITSGSFTVEAWAWRDSITDENGLFNIEDSNQAVILLSAGNNSANSGDYRFLVRNGTFAAGNQSNIQGDLANVGLNEWHHYVGVYDDDTGTATMFVDGVQVDTVTNANTIGYSFSGTLDSGIHIGPSAGKGRWHDGRIGEVRVYPKTLTAAQVFQNYNATRYKYDEIAANISPKIGPGIVYDNLVFNFDFGNDFCIERFGSIQG